MVTLAALLLAIGGSPSARADGTWPSDHGFEIGFRTGVSLPAGDTDPGYKLSDARGMQFPLWVDLGYRVGPVVVGAYGVWAPGLLPGGFGCSSATCLMYAWKAGVEVQIHAARRGARVDPWISFGVGYEWNTYQYWEHTGSDGQETLRGWDLARFGLGVDFALSPGLKIGPFVHGTVSQFERWDHSWGYPTTDVFIEKSLHSWITIGVKLTGLL
jgi:hypothetical protein